MYDSYADASAAVGDPEAIGVSRNEASLTASRPDPGADTRRADNSVADADACDGAAISAALAAAAGGTAGLLAGIPATRRTIGQRRTTR
ncbi:MAG TPA: hypothetical protein VEX11_17070 [Acetobacteraceae bacterium]|nr:hypothetical protein [Acetobacteraceae bacterium]